MQTLEISKLQKSLWFEWKMYPLSSAYNNIYVYRLAPDFDIKLLSAALSSLHKLFPMLSTKLEESFNGIKQYVNSSLDVGLSVFSSKNKLAEFLLSPFNLNGDHLYRYGVVKNINKVYLGFCWHHIITDAQSINIFFQVISELLQNNQAALDCAQYKQLEQVDVHNESSCSSVSYWSSMLKNMPPCIIYSKSNSTLKSTKIKGKRIVFSLTENSASKIMRDIGAHKTTVFIYVVACIAKVLFSDSDHCNLIIGFTQNIRGKNYVNQIGNYTAQYPLILKKPDHISLLLKNISDQILFCRKNSHFGLPEIYKLYRNQNKMSLTKLFNISINYGADSCTQLLGTMPELHENFDCSNDLIIRYEYLYAKYLNGVKISPNTILFELDYNTAVFTDSHIQEIINRLINDELLANK